MFMFAGMMGKKDSRLLRQMVDTPFIMQDNAALWSHTAYSRAGIIACVIGIPTVDASKLESFTSGDVPDAYPSHVLLESYRRDGMDFDKELFGDCLQIIMDARNDKLIVVRDRMGCQPIYYAIAQGTIHFSDHPKPLLEANGITRVVDKIGLNECLSLGPAHTPGLTPFKDIIALKPGHMLVYEKGLLRETPWFTLKAEPFSGTLPEAIEIIHDLVFKATSDAAKLNPASMLSGGLDSSVITAIAAKIMGSTIHTFSIDYEDNHEHFKSNDFQPSEDAPWVEKAVREIGARHTRIEVSIQSLFDTLDAAMDARGWPGMADIDSSLLLLCREIRQSHKYVISGECADEVFGGYPWFHKKEMIESTTFPWSGSMELRGSLVKKDIAQKLDLKGYAQQRYFETISTLPKAVCESAKEARLREIQGLCFNYFMTNLQDRAQRMGDAFGLTVLTPYCNHEIVQFVYNIPWEMRTLNNEPKGILRASMEGLLPHDMLWRKKSPFPKTYNPEYTRLVSQRLKTILDDKSSPIHDIIDTEAAYALLPKAHVPNGLPWFGQLMGGPQMLAYLIQLDSWMKMYKVEIDI